LSGVDGWNARLRAAGSLAGSSCTSPSRVVAVEAGPAVWMSGLLTDAGGVTFVVGAVGCATAGALLLMFELPRTATPRGVVVGLLVFDVDCVVPLMVADELVPALANAVPVGVVVAVVVGWVVCGDEGLERNVPEKGEVAGEEVRNDEGDPGVMDD